METLCAMLLVGALCASAQGTPPAPSPEMQKLLTTLGGT